MFEIGPTHHKAGAEILSFLLHPHSEHFLPTHGPVFKLCSLIPWGSSENWMYSIGLSIRLRHLMIFDLCLNLYKRMNSKYLFRNNKHRVIHCNGIDISTEKRMKKKMSSTLNHRQMIKYKMMHQLEGIN